MNAAILISLGYDPSATIERVQITTGSVIEFVPHLIVEKIAALGHEVVNFVVLSHTLPKTAAVDGLLGLDFLRGRQLILDFRTGEIILA